MAEVEKTGQHHPGCYFWGDTPPEEDYCRAKGVRSTTSFHTSPRGLTLFTRSWEPLPPPSPFAVSSSSSLPLPPPTPRGLVCMIHGYGNDTSWTFQVTPIFLAQHGYACVALDLPGHGRSGGLRAYVPDVDAAVDDCLAYFVAVRRQTRFQGLPRFLYGESMGGAMCLLIHLREPPGAWDGAITVAPMCRISYGLRPRWPIPQILALAARILPTLPVVPMADLVDKSVKVPEKRAIASRNPLRYRGKPRLGTVLELLRVTDDLHARLSEVCLPFLVLHGSADVVTDPNVSQALFEASPSKDKTIKIYEGMMHSLLFGETDENVAIVRADILAWLHERCDGGSKRGSG